MKKFKILILPFILSIIILIYFKDDELKLIMNKNKFNSLLPKIKLNYSEKSNISEIFKSRELFFNDSILTKEYIKYIRDRTLNKKNNFINKNYEGLVPNLSFIYNRSRQINITDFYNLCLKEKMIDNKSFIKMDESPVISVIIVSYNKGDIILKSITSILNQSLKNIEIIIVNDHSSDNSELIFKKLLNKDSRIRVFTHLKNMGVWRSRLDGFLFSNAPYVIHFDGGDFYADNFILEDIYTIIDKYNLDSVRFGFRETFNMLSSYG